MNAPTTAEYCIARTIFACNDHGRGGREYWDHDAVTWRFTTTSDDRVSLELYAQKGASGPGPQAAGYDTTRLLGTWDLGPLAQLDLVLSGQLAANGNTRPGFDSVDSYDVPEDEADELARASATGPSAARPGWLIDECGDYQHLTLRTLNYLEYQAVCDTLGHPDHNGYIARVQANTATMAARHASRANLSEAEQFAAVLDDLCTPRN
jgi:hypothetical protein